MNCDLIEHLLSFLESEDLNEIISDETTFPQNLLENNSDYKHLLRIPLFTQLSSTSKLSALIVICLNNLITEKHQFRNIYPLLDYAVTNGLSSSCLFCRVCKLQTICRCAEFLHREKADLFYQNHFSTVLYQIYRAMNKSHLVKCFLDTFESKNIKNTDVLHKIAKNFLLAPKERGVVFKTLLDPSNSSVKFRRFCTQCFATLISQPSGFLEMTTHLCSAKIPVSPQMQEESIAKLVVYCPLPSTKLPLFLSRILEQIFEVEAETWSLVWLTTMDLMATKHVDVFEDSLDKLIIAKMNDSHSLSVNIQALNQLIRIESHPRLGRVLRRYLNDRPVPRISTIFRLQVNNCERAESTSNDSMKLLSNCLNPECAANTWFDCLVDVYTENDDVMRVVGCLTTLADNMSNVTEAICSFLELIVEAFGKAMTNVKASPTDVRLVESLNPLISHYLNTIFLQDSTKMVKFVKVCLNTVSSDFQTSNGDDLDNARERSAMSILQLILIVIGSFIMIGGIEWDLFDQFTPQLEALKERWKSSSSVHKLASEIILTVKSRGTKGFQGSDIDVGMLSEEFEAELSSVRSEFDEAIENATCLDCVVTQARGIVELTRLIQRRDYETLQNDKKVLQIFITCLNDDDSYVYLAGINGLVELCDRFHEDIVPILVSEFAGINSHMSSVEVRLEMGEVIVKVCRRLGDLLPMYKNSLLNLLLVACRDKEALIRSSGLSSLGEFLKCARFSVMTHVAEIVELVKSSMSDSSSDVKRAAISLVVLLLQGMKDNELFSILGTSLRDISRIIRLASQDYSDSTLQMHAELAVAELERCIFSD